MERSGIFLTGHIVTRTLVEKYLMRLIILSILFFIVGESFSQDLRGSLKVLTYIRGCHGNCEYSYADYSDIDNCGVQKDSIIEIVNVFSVNGELFINDKLTSKQDRDSLMHFIKTRNSKISELVKDVIDEKNAEFIPPRASCFEFEEYQIYMDTKVISYIILNGELNENGSLLQQGDIENFERLKKIIK